MNLKDIRFYNENWLTSLYSFNLAKEYLEVTNVRP